MRNDEPRRHRQLSRQAALRTHVRRGARGETRTPLYPSSAGAGSSPAATGVRASLLARGRGETTHGQGIPQQARQAARLVCPSASAPMDRRRDRIEGGAPAVGRFGPMARRRRPSSSPGSTRLRRRRLADAGSGAARPIAEQRGVSRPGCRGRGLTATMRTANAGYGESVAQTRYADLALIASGPGALQLGRLSRRWPGPARGDRPRAGTGPDTEAPGASDSRPMAAGTSRRDSPTRRRRSTCHPSRSRSQ